MKISKLKRYIAISLCLVGSSTTLFAKNSMVPEILSDPPLTIHTILSNVSEQTDLARIKLTIDTMIDPSINIEASLKQFDHMVKVIKTMAGPSATDMQKMLAVRKFIYETGAWNAHRPFHYDHDDPLGLKISNKMMHHYLANRSGNCITMPFLFILLADRMGLNVTASTAPVHVFVKFTDGATGTTFNIETTSGANPARDSWYQQNMPMTDMALNKGVYMQPLSRVETIVVMASVLVEHYLDQMQYQEAIEMTDILLPYYPNYAYLYTKKGTAYYGILKDKFYQKYPAPKDIPLGERQVYQFLSEQNHGAFDKAEALGWRPEGWRK